ncbi:MAG: hypothetical protein Q8P86_00120 [bacterium]|nr:hypothetical protein [bacterium]
MNLAIILFAVSLSGMAVLVILKMRSLSAGRVGIFSGTEKVEKNIETFLKSYRLFVSRLRQGIRHLFTSVKEVAIAKTGEARNKGKSMMIPSVSKRRRYSRKRGAVSFFLKDVAEYKKEISGKENRSH